MAKIDDWFKTMDYNAGVEIYASSPFKNNRYLEKLRKGKNQRNLAILISELRRISKATTLNSNPKESNKAKKENLTGQDSIEKSQEKNKVIAKRTQEESQGIRAGDLPAKLRYKFFKARSIFNEMIELKFALNELPNSAQESALKIQTKIFEIDEQRDLLWDEINHYIKHGTLLPSADDDDEYRDKSPEELWRIKRNLESSVAKMQKRVNNWYAVLDKTSNKKDQVMLEAKINRSEKKLHLNRTKIKNIKDLLP